jgi:hypothetical protein
MLNNPFRGNARFATVLGTKPIYIEEDAIIGTVASFYHGLKSSGHVNDRHTAASSLPLRLYVYENQVLYLYWSHKQLMHVT